jgi:hypothetical protein
MTEIKIFKYLKKCLENYPIGHNYYKLNLKKTKLELRGALLNLRNLGSTKILELDAIAKVFLEDSSPSQKICEEIIYKINCAIQDLEIIVEKQKGSTERIYDKGSPFDFHTDLKDIIGTAKKELFIIEPFIDDHLLELTLKDVNRQLNVKILTNSKNSDKRGKFEKLANLFKTQQTGGFAVQEIENMHDRGLFIDGVEGWVMGQSIKDAAKNKPTYLIKLQNPQKLELIYKKMWALSKKIK